MGVLRAGQVWAPPNEQRAAWVSRFRLQTVLKERDLPVSGPRSARPPFRCPDIRPGRRPNTSQPRAPRPQGPSCPSLSFPLLSFNMGRAVVKNPPTLVSPGFLSRSYFSAPDPPCSATLSSVTAFPALVRFWLSAPKSPRHLRSL